MTTHGGRATEMRAAVGTPAASSTSFAKAFEPSIRAAAALGPKTADAGVAERVREARDERRLRADDGEVDLELAAEREQALAVLGAHRVALAEPSDAGIAGRGVQRFEPGALLQLPGERVLAPAGPNDQDPHGGESTHARGEYASADGRRA